MRPPGATTTKQQQEAETMRKTLEDFYFGNITACENFVLGFRLGARIMAECMDEDDGNTQKVTDHA